MGHIQLFSEKGTILCLVLLETSKEKNDYTSSSMSFDCGKQKNKKEKRISSVEATPKNLKLDIILLLSISLNFQTI